MKPEIQNLKPEIFSSPVSAFRFQVSAFQNAFSLVEVTMALGIAGFCLLTIFGLLSTGMTSNKNAIEQTAAASIATGIFADLRATPKTTIASPQYGIPFPTTPAQAVYFSEDGAKTTAAAARYRATITINPASPTAFVNIKITWPAAAPAASAPVAFEATTAIDRR